MSHAMPGVDEVCMNDGPAPPVPGDIRQLTPEQRLLRELLQQAMRDYVHKGGRLRTEAEVWFLDVRDDEGSFRWVCGHLGLNPDYVWANREQWRAQGHDGTRRHRGRITVREAA